MTLTDWHVQDALVPNQRTGRRLRVRQQAKIVLPGTMIHCEVQNLSMRGAMIALGQDADLPETFRLFIAAHSLRTFTVRLRWQEGRTIGVSFEMDA